jgi:6,7-dimethyl-8-ribityllumazine synthase
VILGTAVAKVVTPPNRSIESYEGSITLVTTGYGETRYFKGVSDPLARSIEAVPVLFHMPIAAALFSADGFYMTAGFKGTMSGGQRHCVSSAEGFVPIGVDIATIIP